MNCFDSISPDALAVLASLVAIAISNGLNSSEINVLGNFVTAVGGVLLTIAAQQDYLSTQKDTEQDEKYIVEQIELLKKQFDLIQKQLKMN